MGDNERMLAYIDSIEDEMIEFWKQLVLLESNSYDKEGVDRVGKTLEAFCREKLGYYTRFEQDPVYGNCLAACSCPFEAYTHGIVLSAHMDTVHKAGSFDPVVSQDETYLYGPGAGDCKGGIVMALTTALALKEIGYDRRPVKLLFAADEEIGSCRVAIICLMGNPASVKSLLPAERPALSLSTILRALAPTLAI